MASGRLEAPIEERVWRAAEELGWWQIKIMRASKRGVPDRLFLRQGRVVFIEMKGEGEEPSLQQHIRMGEIRAQRVECYWFDNYEDAISVLR